MGDHERTNVKYHSIRVREVLKDEEHCKTTPRHLFVQELEHEWFVKKRYHWFEHRENLPKKLKILKETDCSAVIYPSSFRPRSNSTLLKLNKRGGKGQPDAVFVK